MCFVIRVGEENGKEDENISKKIVENGIKR